MLASRTSAGIHTLDISYCKWITGAGLAHLAGIHTLHMFDCSPTLEAVALALGLPTP